MATAKKEGTCALPQKQGLWSILAYPVHSKQVVNYLQWGHLNTVITTAPDPTPQQSSNAEEVVKCVVAKTRITRYFELWYKHSDIHHVHTHTRRWLGVTSLPSTRIGRRIITPNEVTVSDKKFHHTLILERHISDEPAAKRTKLCDNNIIVKSHWPTLFFQSIYSSHQKTNLVYDVTQKRTKVNHYTAT